ncbi:hypothetical protein L2E82_11632 [Cichorium intybus]|uniref:Uncharacterized protein n=1 Tax=Cichorium intybus TaxID=13427 RepID=A0ACB9GDC6_CICIN|nr:hypothetical protein L2E82_11632 [Cichorium intybus]
MQEEPNRKVAACTKLQNRKALSVKFKDIIRGSGQNKRKSKISQIGRASSSDGSFISGNSKSTTQNASSSSDEIRKTIQIGCAIGYQIHGEEDAIRDLINSEGGRWNFPILTLEEEDSLG